MDYRADVALEKIKELQVKVLIIEDNIKDIQTALNAHLSIMESILDCMKTGYSISD